VENQGDDMPTREDRRLKLVKGAAAPASPGRPVRRRAVTRRTVRTKDPVTAILERLDDEAVADGDEPVEASGGPVAARDEPDGGGRRRRRFPPRRGGSRRHLAVGVLVAVLCAALTAAGMFGYRWYEDRALDGARQQALAAAKQTTVNFVSVSASSVDRDLQRIVDGATGEFKDQFTRGQSQVRAAIVENKVESRGSVLRAGLVSGDRRAAVVLVAVDATVKNVHAPDGRPSHYRIQVDVTRDADSGKWLVSRLQFVG
jgi:Mce-associated membrane protein